MAAAMSKTSSLLFICFLATFVLWVGTIEGQQVADLATYELTLDKFVKIKVTNLGARLMSVYVPDLYGRWEDILLGYDTVQEYLNDTFYMGATVGRVANVIREAKFTLNNVVYPLKTNQHDMYNGGAKSFDKAVWKLIEHKTQGEYPKITFTHRSLDGDDGFPGEVIANVTYTLDKAVGLKVNMTAQALNKATPINMAHYTYWNLGGNQTHNVKTHEVQISASKTVELDKLMVPTGGLQNYINYTCYDFNMPDSIDFKLKKLRQEWGEYYTFNTYYVFNQGVGPTKANVFLNKTGRSMRIETNQPGLQFSTGEILVGSKGKHGIVYKAHPAVSLVPQGYPDAVNNPTFPQYIVQPGRRYEHYVNYGFLSKVNLKSEL